MLLWGIYFWMTSLKDDGKEYSIPRVLAGSTCMALTAGCFAAFWFLPSTVIGAAALCLGGFCLYGPQALTGVTATNISTKRFAGTSIGFISLFSYVGVSVAGKVCGSLAQSSGGWRLPVLVMVATAAFGALLFACLWRTRANAYEGS